MLWVCAASAEVHFEFAHKETGLASEGRSEEDKRLMQQAS